MARILHFAAPGTLAECARALAAQGVECAPAADAGTVCYLDRPDGWLRAHGWLLSHHRLRGASQLRLRRMGREGELVGPCSATVPASTADITAPPLRGQLERLLGASALDVVQRWHTTTMHNVQRGDRAPGARAAGCALEATMFRAAETVTTTVLVAVQPAGRQDETACAEALPAALGWRALAGDVHLELENAWVAAARATAPTFDPAAPAAPAVAAILLDYHARMDAEIGPDSTVLGVDAVHDFRVALRRSRTLLRAFRRDLGTDQARRFQDEFAWLSRATSAVRDLDVMLAAVGSANPPYAGLTRRARDGLLDFLVTLRQREQGTLLRLLAGARFRHLHRAWRALLASLCLAVPSTRGAPATLGARVRRALRAAHERVLADVTAYSATPDPVLLHDLRKRCKRLRYLVDAFSALYPQAHVDPLLAQLKHLQTVMGERCDRRAQHEMLVRWRRRRAAPVPGTTLRATLNTLARSLACELSPEDDAELDDALAELDSPAGRARVAALQDAMSA